MISKRLLGAMLFGIGMSFNINVWNLANFTSSAYNLMGFLFLAIGLWFIVQDETSTNKLTLTLQN